MGAESLDTLCQSTISDIAPLIEQQQLSPVELTHAMLSRIQRLNPQLHAYLAISAEHALDRAQQTEREIKAGDYKGPLHGIPIAIKDLFFTDFAPTTCASKILQNWHSDHNAAVVDKLEQAGAIILGKLNMTEFAQGGYHPSLKAPVNPWNPKAWTGVSSSGSGVATSASLCFASLGTDTGGSIRFPAACNNVVGLKPTYGLVSRYGSFALAHSLDHIGPLARSVEDATIMLDAIAGYDSRDGASIQQPQRSIQQATQLSAQGLRIGIDETYITDNVDPEVAQAVFDAVTVLESQGATRVTVDITAITELNNHWYPVTAAEALSAHQDYYPSQAEDYGPHFKQLLDYGNQLSAADYTRSLAARDYAKSILRKAFAVCDVIACPAMPTPPFSLDEVPNEAVLPPEAIAPLMSFIAPYNFTGNPTLNMPAGKHSSGLPLSVQFVADHLGEEQLIRTGHNYERVTEWHKQHPDLTPFESNQQ
ncbi:amidase [Maricurvus nonylphenolicus]|uniref:amidase n=1 Tax=Maricurvus nonylphenolicus TaxID=1008307 RepID=UPI0036F2B408